ncbi:MAG: hypothetical protein AB1349_10090 [Elusimicrobiota bacterium]
MKYLKKSIRAGLTVKIREVIDKVNEIVEWINNYEERTRRLGERLDRFKKEHNIPD